MERDSHARESYLDSQFQRHPANFLIKQLFTDYVIYFGHLETANPSQSTLEFDPIVLLYIFHKYDVSVVV